MRSLSSILIVFLYFSNTCICTVDIDPKTYEIDTSKPASEYLQSMCDDFRDKSQAAFNRMINIIPPLIARKFRPMAWDYYKSGKMKEPYKSEIEYLSKCLSISIENMVLINLVYEFMPACTSIILYDKTGKIIHGRNQDFPTILRDTVFNVKYMKHGKLLFQGTSFFGYVGIPTGIKYGSFSITMNARVSLDYWNNLKAIDDFWFPSGWLPREALIHAKNFKQAVATLRDTRIMSDIYYIIAGKNNGVVIARDVKTTFAMTWLKPPKLKKKWSHRILDRILDRKSEKKWYILETNYDDWQDPLNWIVEGTKAGGRKKTAVQLLNKVGQKNMNKKKLYKILSTPPVLAEDTVYTTIFSPVESYYYTKIRKKTPLEGVGLNEVCKDNEDCVNERWDVACCNGQCTVKLFDYIGLKSFCPNKCKGCSFCKFGSCNEINSKNKDDKCLYHEQCIGHGLNSDDMACCQTKSDQKRCTKKKKDYTGLDPGYCPNECKAGAGCPLGTCPTNGQHANEQCKCHEQCKGHGLGFSAMACCDGVCKKKKYGFCPANKSVILSIIEFTDVVIICIFLLVMVCVGFLCGVSMPFVCSWYWKKI